MGRSSRNRKKRRNVTNYNNFVRTNQQNYMKLHLNHNLEEILSNTNDIIAKRIIDDSKKEAISTKISWLNITKSPDHISYSIPSKSKTPEQAWSKENRQPNQIRKLIRKIYGNQFSNRQIKTFISKFKTQYNNFIKKKESEKSDKIFIDILSEDETKRNNKILDNILEKTEKKELLWEKISQNENYSKYRSTINITKNKNLILELYLINKENITSFVKIYFFNGKYKNQLKRIRDEIAIKIIESYIDETPN